MIRKWLADIRLSEDKTQEYVASEIKVTQQFYSAVESGERRPSPEKAKEISRVASKYMPKGDTLNKAMRDAKGVRVYHRRTKFGNTTATVGNLFAKAMDVITAFNETVEAAPRMVAFKRAYIEGGKTKDAILDATRAAREATSDFQRRGNAVSGAAVAIPFIGASIAGIDQFRRITMTKEAWTTKEGRQRLMRAAITQAIPAVLMAIMYADDDDWKDLPAYVKDNYWLIKIPFTDGKFLRIPKDRENSAIFSTSFQLAALKYLQPDFDNKEEVAGYLDYILQNFVPTHEITGWAIWQAENNKRWSGGPIVSQRDEDLMVKGHYDEIYDETTSKLAVNLAKILPDVDKFGAANTSEGIEYIIDQLTGGIGDIILPLTTPSSGGIANNLLRRYMTDSVYSNKYSNEAYETLADLEGDYESNKRIGIKDEKTEAWKKAFNNTLSGQSDKFTTVSDYYAEIRDNNNDLTLTKDEREEKNRELRKNINRITEALVKAYKGGGMPEGYSFADVVIPPEASEYGITDEQYSKFINSTTGDDVPNVEKKLVLATMPDLTAEQKSYLSETVLKNKSYDEWGPAFEQLSASGIDGDTAAKLYQKMGGSKASSVIKQFKLVADPELTAEQKKVAAAALLENNDFDEWAPKYAALQQSGMTTESLDIIDTAVSHAGKGDPHTWILKSGKNKGKPKTEAIEAGSPEDTGAEGHKSASRKKMEAIKAAYPDASKETLRQLYSLYGVSEKLY